MELTMKFVAFSAIFAFSIVSVLGFSGMAHGSHAMHHSCLFDITSSCSALVDPIKSTTEHLSSLQSSLQAVLVGQVSILSLLLLAFLLIIAIFVLSKIKPKVRQYFQRSKAQFHHSLFEFKAKFLAWLSILNKRDHLVFVAVR